MPEQKPEIIAKYEVLFAMRTGVTILMPKSSALDTAKGQDLGFRVSPDSPGDLLIDKGARPAILRGLQPDYLEEAMERGFIMFYETKDDEVIRCTPCNFLK